MPKNVYVKETLSLDPVVMDSERAPEGLYLLQQSACNLGLLELTPADAPQPEKVEGPQHLIKKGAKSEATTIRRATIKTVTVSLNKSKEVKEQAETGFQESKSFRD